MKQMMSGAKGTAQRRMLAKAIVRGQRAANKNYFRNVTPMEIDAVQTHSNLSKKGMDTDVSIGTLIATTNTNAGILPLNLVQQGAGSWNRVGRKAINESLRLKGVVTFAAIPTVATGVYNAPVVRLVVVWDQQPSSGAIPNFDVIFGITAQDGTESCPDITCPPRYDNMDRFKVLLDKTLNPFPGPAYNTGTGPILSWSQSVDEYIKLGKRETVFSGQSNPMTLADISTGALYLVVRAGRNDGTFTSALDAVARLRYYA